LPEATCYASGKTNKFALPPVLLGLLKSALSPESGAPIRALGRTVLFEIMFVLAAIMFTRSGRAHLSRA
jgi:hypothetical protein